MILYSFLPKIKFATYKNTTYPVSLIFSTIFHFIFFLFLINEGYVLIKKKKNFEFVTVKIVELPKGEGGSLTGIPGGKKEEEVKSSKLIEKEPKLSLPSSKTEQKKEGKSPIKNPNPEGKAVGLGKEGPVGLGGSSSSILLDAKDFEYEWYKARLEQTLKMNWKKPLLNKKVSASVHFVILEDGKVSNVTIVKSSGNPDFDRSVLKAIYDSQPFPKFPPAYNSPSLGVLYTFELELPKD